MRLRPSSEAEDTVLIDTAVYDDEGRAIAVVEEMALRRMSADAMTAEAGNRAATWMHEVEWRAKPRTDAAAAEPVKGTVWIVLGDRAGAAAPLIERLDAEGARTFVVGRAKDYQFTDRDARLDPAEPSHFLQLLADVRRAAGKRPHAVLDFWTLEPQAGDALLDSVRLGTGSVLHTAQALAADEQPARLWIVTAGASAAAPNPSGLAVAQAPVFGLARSISVEHPELRATCIDLDPASIAGSVAAMWPELTAPEAEDLIAFRGGTRHVARLVRSPLAAPKKGPSGPVSLEIGAKGMLDKLELRPLARTPPAAGEVEIRVTAAGLNFRDVLNALGMYEGPAGPLGAECVGVVTAVGAGVQHVSLGDTVLGMAVGSLRSYVNAPADTMIVKPPALTDAEAATIPITFLTAEYALNRLARMKKGERVLIHAGAGGVGLAAVQIAQRAGAEVFATAGSPEKHAYLHSIGVKHVLSSRSLDFADGIRALTNGEGVDIVLNSLTGDFITNSVAILRPGGRFLEIGRAGIWTPEQMRAARPDITYFPIYLGEPDVKPAAIQGMLRDLMPAFASGELRPLRHQIFAFNDAPQAFRHMAAARHIGKIVFDVADADMPVALKAHATYLVTGGLGALGIRVAQWMADAGARTIVLTGRSAPSDRARTAIAELERAGVEVVIAQADVAKAADVDRLIAGLAGRPPLAGIVHAAGVIDDGVLLQQNWARFEKVFGPKVLGAWHLHTRTLDAPLDFFVTFSSMVTVVGAPGQGNYAAANAFLDALSHHRRAIGKPALTINWGPWADSGMAAGVDEREQRRWKSQGVTLIQPDEGLAAMAKLLFHRHAPAQVAVLPLDWSIVLQRFAAGDEPPFVADLAAALSRGKQASVAAPRTKLLPEVEAAAPHLRRGLALSRLRAEAVTLLGLGAAAKVDPVQPLRELGLDSLMSVELRNAIAELLDRNLPATFLFKYPTLDALTDFVVSEVGDTPGETSNAPAETAQTSPDTAVEPVQDLSDEEARKLLMEELDTLSSEWISEKN
jgi:NADPH:quinone reductase-like Zn-dependent oxidoreductase/acyl carrier protein